MTPSKKFVSRPSGSAIAADLPETDEAFLGLPPLVCTPVPHSSSHSLASLEGDPGLSIKVGLGFGDSVISGDDCSPSLPPDKDGSRRLEKLFGSKPCFNCESSIVDDSPELDSLKDYCALDEGCAYHIPRDGDRIWKAPRPGWQVIPFICFGFGFRLPMHHFFSMVFEALGCGFGQLSPNSLGQITGVIARCHELKVLPSLELLFAIFTVKNTGGQLYLDKKSQRVRLFDAAPSNAGWHTRWAYLEGGGLDRVNRWSNISKSRLRILSRLPETFSEKFLNSFHGKHEKYTTDDFTDVGFLHKHGLAGEPLLAFVRSHPKMPSDALLAMLAKRGASSKIVLDSEVVDEQGSEGNSRMPESACVPVVVAAEVEGAPKALKESDKKRHRKDGDGSSRHYQKPKESKEPKSTLKERADVKSKEPKEPKGALNREKTSSGSSLLGSVSTGEAMIGFKDQLNQLVVNFDRVMKIANFDGRGSELKRLKHDVEETEKQKGVLNIRIREFQERDRKAKEAFDAMKHKVDALESDKEALNSLTASYQKIESDLTAEIGRLKNEYGEVLEKLKLDIGNLADEVAVLRTDLEHSREENLKSLEEGYLICFKRAEKAGYAMGNHTFEKYCQSLAETRHEVGSSSGAQGGAA